MTRIRLPLVRQLVELPSQNFVLSYFERDDPIQVRVLAEERPMSEGDEWFWYSIITLIDFFDLLRSNDVHSIQYFTFQRLMCFKIFIMDGGACIKKAVYKLEWFGNIDRHREQTEELRQAALPRANWMVEGF